MPAARVLQQACQRALQYVRQVQLRDGSFASFSSPSRQPFVQRLTYRTTFVPSLILAALGAVPGSEDIRQPLATWLLRQASPTGSYNYWAQNSAERQAMPYPDDLDDTFCAYIALQRHDPALIDGTRLAQAVKLLIACETQVGGPYRTWLVSQDSAAPWQDVDLAVNANIAYFLRQATQAEVPPNVTALLAQAIIGDGLTSPYYPDTIPLLYYLSRAQSGPEPSRRLAERIQHAAKHTSRLKPLQAALLLSAMLNIGRTAAATLPAAKLLGSQLADGSWPADAFCLDPTKQGKRHFHGAPALTTAFALEALTQYTTQQTSTPVAHRRPVTITADYDRVMQLATQQITDVQPLLRRLVRDQLSRTRRSDRNHEVALLPHLFHCSLTKPTQVDTACLDTLGAANLLGWAAYTIYDDFLDEEGDPLRLSAANLALRRSVALFMQALPGRADFGQLVTHTFDVIDAANTWEVATCRFAVTDDHINLGVLPHYGRLQRLAERSLGHTLTPVAVLAASGLALDDPAVHTLQRALRHYLIARQLNDDAHDWEADVRRGHISYAVAAILQALRLPPGKQSLAVLIPRMQKQFWHHTLPELCNTISRHNTQARNLLLQHILLPNSPCTAIFDDIDTAITHTQTEQAKAQAFLAAYKA